MVLKHRPAVEAPPDRPRAVPAAPLPPLPLGAPARSVGVLHDLRAADATLGMQHPAAPKPRRDPEPLAWHALAKLSVVVAVYDHVADEIDTLLSELAALAPLTEAVAL